MAEFLAELRRRHIYRIGGIYVVVAWGITQVLDVLSQMFDLPDWIAQPSLVALTIGFPVVLIAAWTIVGAARATDTPAELKKATATDWALLGALIVVIGLIGYERFFPASSESVVASAEQDSAAFAVADAIVEGLGDRLENSVAVLPFENVSPNPDDAYFAVGVHDAILTQLSKLRNVTVIARTSVLQYPGSGKTIPEIADELNVQMVMEGSVSYAGNQVQVTARLIDGMTNNLMWTEPYNGELSDIFGIQADIAMRIANSLQAEFSDAERENLETPATSSPQAYEMFSKAKAVAEQEGYLGPEMSRRTRIQNFLDQALELDPSFALATAWKAFMYLYSSQLDRVAEEDRFAYQTEMRLLAFVYAEKALVQDPSLGLPHIVRANFFHPMGFETERDFELEKALELSPNDAFVIREVSRFSSSLEERIRAQQRVVQIDPNDPENHSFLGQTLLMAGRPGEAREAFMKCVSLNPNAGGCARELATAYYVSGDHDAAYNELKRAEQVSRGGLNTITEAIHGYGLLGRNEDAQRAFDDLTRRDSTECISHSQWAKAYMGIGNYEEALSRLKSEVENLALPENEQRCRGGAGVIVYNVWSDPRLDQPAFLEVRERLREVAGFLIGISGDG